MVYYILTALACVGLGLLVRENSIYACRGEAVSRSKRQEMLNKTAAFGIFFILTFISGTRIAVGNDFWVYRDNFERIANSLVVSSEIGFNLIVKIVQWFAGYDKYMPIFFVFSLITVYFFVKALYDESEWFAASAFLLLTNGFYFSSLNTVRYYLVFAVALYSLKLVINDKHLQFIALIVCAATIHMTVLIVIPLYYLAKVNFKKRDIPLAVIFSALLILLREPVRKLVFVIYPYYEGSYLDNYEISYVNILKAAAVLVFTLIFYRQCIKDNVVNRFYFNLNIGALIVFSCLWYLPETTRIGYYLSASNIFLIPSVIKGIKDKRTRIFFATVIALFYIVFFAFYLNTLDSVEIRILPYRNWFFAR